MEAKIIQFPTHRKAKVISIDQAIDKVDEIFDGPYDLGAKLATKAAESNYRTDKQVWAALQAYLDNVHKLLHQVQLVNETYNDPYIEQMVNQLVLDIIGSRD